MNGLMPRRRRHCRRIAFLALPTLSQEARTTGAVDASRKGD
jgi:hypothetical protein